MTILYEKLKEDLITARKSKDSIKVKLLSLLIAGVKDKEIVLREKNKKITDEDIISILQKHSKNIEENIVVYEEKSFLEEAEKEKEELAFIRTYLPKQMSKEETIKIICDTIKEVKASSIRDIGKVMGSLNKNYKGSIDMKLAKDIFTEEVSNA